MEPTRVWDYNIYNNPNCDYFLLPSSLTEEDQMLIKKTTHLCKKNQDIFKQFYEENKEIYDELSTKLMAVKKPRKLIKK